MPDVTVTWTIGTALAPMTALDNVTAESPAPGTFRFVWDDPPAAEGITHVLGRVWLASGTKPVEPTADFGTGVPLPNGRSYGEVTGLAGGVYSWGLRPGREE